LKAGWTPLIHAAYAGDADCIALLIGAGAKLEAKTKDGWTPLIHAAYAGDAACIALLLGAGAKLGAKTKNGPTARDMAMLANNHQWEEVVKLLDAHAVSSETRELKCLFVLWSIN